MVSWYIKYKFFNNHTKNIRISHNNNRTNDKSNISLTIDDELKKENLTDALNELDKADITTFDAYSLSLVKKYYYLLEVSPDIGIIDSSVIYLYKEKF